MFDRSGSATPLRPPREADKNEEAETGKKPEQSATTVADRYFPATWASVVPSAVGGLTLLLPRPVRRTGLGVEGRFNSPLCHLGMVCSSCGSRCDSGVPTRAMHHCESVSSAVINSFLAAGRSIPGTRMTAKELLARKSLARRSPTPITSDFFTPNPQRVKGKARAGIGLQHVDLLPDELKQECARSWLLDTTFWERFRFEGTYSSGLWTGLLEINGSVDLDLDRTVFTYPARLPRHCTPARAIPSSQRRYTTPRHISPRYAYPPPRPRPFSNSASRYADPSYSSSSKPHHPFDHLENLLRPPCSATPQESADPDKAWETFLAVVEGGAEIPPRLRPILFVFATRLAGGAFAMACNSSSTPAEEMSSRAAKVRRILGVITNSRFPARLELEIMEARCMALEGRLGEVEAVLDNYCGRGFSSEDALNDTPLVQISQVMVRVIETLHGPEAAYDWAVSRWAIVERYLWTKSVPLYSRASRLAAANLRNTLMHVVEKIEDPGAFLAERTRTRPDRPWKEVGEHLIDVLCALQLPWEALDVVQQMERLSIPPSVNIRLVIVKALSKKGSFGSARGVYAQVCREMEDAREAELREVWSTGLYLHAKEGGVEEAREDFRRLEERNWINFESIALMLHATAVEGLVKQTIETFERFFPRGVRSSQLMYGKPTKTHYTEVLFAHAQAGNMDRVHTWLKRMVEDKISPDPHTYAILLKGFGSSGNFPSFSRLLGRMNSFGVPLNLHGYTTVISLLAQTGDSFGAEQMFQKALKDGIKPDIMMLNALMYAHVQSGHWKGVVHTFNYIKSLPGERHRPTTATYNTILKAYVLLGTPFSIVSDLVVEQEALGTRPNAHTFALLVQSACDSREFDLALGLLAQMDRLASKVESEVEVTVYVLTILMGSFLRYGDKVRAREMFEQMKSRNIVPTAITYSTIIHAYAQGKTPKTLELAEAFLRQVIAMESDDDGLRAGWVSSSGGRSLALNTLYQPLMHIYAKLRQVEDVGRLQKELLDQGGKTSLGGLTALLATYRNEGDVKAGKKTWSLIYEMASQRSELGDILSSDKTKSDGRQELMFQSNILCVPLSIYIDLLSSTGHHTEVAKVWDKLRTHGFTFDSHNWNHLIIALIRAGEPERAFAILERVILPNATPTSSPGEAEYGRRRRQPDSPLSIVGGNNVVSLPVEEGSPAEPPAWTEVTAHKYNKRMEGVRQISKYLEYHPMVDASPPGDFTRRLETLQLIPLTWNSWRPHSVTLSVLSQTLTRLASGRLVHPIQGNSGASGPDRSVSRDRPTSNDDSTTTAESAKAVLNRIYGNYREAVQAVRVFERREHERVAGSVEEKQSIRWT